jgi:hypothetical protein
MDLANTSGSWWNGVKVSCGAADTSTGQCGSVYSLRDMNKVIQLFCRGQTSSVVDSTVFLLLDNCGYFAGSFCLHPGRVS